MGIQASQDCTNDFTVEVGMEEVPGNPTQMILAQDLDFILHATVWLQYPT